MGKASFVSIELVMHSKGLDLAGVATGVCPVSSKQAMSMTHHSPGPGQGAFASDERWLAIVPAATGGAAFPQLLRM